MITSQECWMRERCNKKCNKSFCIKLYKLDYLYELALITIPQRKYKELRVDKDESDKEAFTMLKQIQEDIEDFISKGKNIYIHSEISGNGKTSWALRLIQSYFEKIWYKSDLRCRALFINVPKFLLEIKSDIREPSEYAEHIRKNVLDADLVIWDEIGVKTITTFEHEHLLTLINNRLENEKSNIYTSNLSPEELREKLGDRLYSRIVNKSIEFEFKGSDKRHN